MTAVVAALVVALPWVFAAASVLATIVHTIDEVVSEERTIVEYLSDVYGLPHLDYVPGLVALALFGGAQIGLACVGYVDDRAWALWALLAVRVGDIAVSHWLPWYRGHRPNPGLMSSPLYALDAAAVGMVLAGWLY